MSCFKWTLAAPLCTMRLFRVVFPRHSRVNLLNMAVAAFHPAYPRLAALRFVILSCSLPSACLVIRFDKQTMAQHMYRHAYSGA